MELANQILPHIIQVDNIIDDNPLVIANKDDFEKLNDKTWSSITVSEQCDYDPNTELILNNYPHVQLIHFQERSCTSLFSLTISNLPELKCILFEDYSCIKVNSLILSSIF